MSQTSTLILGADNGAMVTAPVVSFTSGKGAGYSPSGLFTVKFRQTTTDGAMLPPILVGTGVFLQKLGKGAGQFRKDGMTGQVVIGE